jgi:Phage integrase family
MRMASRRRPCPSTRRGRLSGNVRSVPLVDAAAEGSPVSTELGCRATTADSCSLNPTAATSPTTWRYGKALERAGLRPLRFHDLRHTFGSLAISRADIVEVQAWMGHAHVKTTMRYLHYRDRADAAARLNAAFGTGRDDRSSVTAGI